MAKQRAEKRAPPPPETTTLPLESVVPSSAPWKKPQGLSRRDWGILLGLLVLINLPILHHFLKGPMDAPLSIPFADSFSTGNLEDRYFSTGGDWRTREGFLISPGVHNNVLWLKAKLPADVRIAFDARAIVADGDVRAEVFGNGVDTLSGYRLVLSAGGNGTRAVLYRLGENGSVWSELQMRAGRAGPIQSGLYGTDTAVRVEGASLAIRPNDAQHWVIERRGSILRWLINGMRVVEFDDPIPLTGKNHDRFGFSSGEVDVVFDGLRVDPAEGGPFPAVASSATPLPPPVGPFSDRFDRDELGPDWVATDPEAVTLVNGALTLERAHNHPVWLSRRLPDDAVIELDVWSESPDGDLKVEAWGDGASAHQGDLHAAYTASGYVLVMGGWKNSRSIIARREEHGEGLAERTDVRVEPNRHYHWRITRQGRRLTWEIDGHPFLAFDDPSPLRGPGQDHFAVSDWETRVHFDNLTIKPL